jgi:hypothetical protein
VYILESTLPHPSGGGGEYQPMLFGVKKYEKGEEKKCRNLGKKQKDKGEIKVSSTV